MIASSKYEKRRTLGADWETIESTTKLRRNDTKNYFKDMKNLNQQQFSNVMSILDNNKQQEMIVQKKK